MLTLVLAVRRRRCAPRCWLERLGGARRAPRPPDRGATAAAAGLLAQVGHRGVREGLQAQPHTQHSGVRLQAKGGEPRAAGSRQRTDKAEEPRARNRNRLLSEAQTPGFFACPGPPHLSAALRPLQVPAPPSASRHQLLCRCRHQSRLAAPKARAMRPAPDAPDDAPLASGVSEGAAPPLAAWFHGEWPVSEPSGLRAAHAARRVSKQGRSESARN